VVRLVERVEGHSECPFVGLPMLTVELVGETLGISGFVDVLGAALRP